MRTPSAFVLGFLFLLAAGLPAQEMLAVNFLGQAFGVDLLTGQGRSIGQLPLANCNAMASHEGVLYATGTAPGGALIRLLALDPITAQPTTVIPNLGVDIRALCSNEGTNQLFGIANAVPNDLLVRIDLGTGAVTTIGSTGFNGIQAIDAGGGFGPLFGWDVNLGLVRIDRSTGVATDVDPNLGAQGVIIQFLSSWLDNNGLHMVGGNTSLYEVNRFSGLVTQVGTSTNLADLRGAEHRRGRATAVGAGCAAAGTTSATLGAKAEFLAGGTIPFSSLQHAPNALGILIVGLSAPPPVNLDPIFGTTGCQLYATPDLLLLFQANGSGGFSMPFTMPPQFGLAVHFQLGALEPVPGGWSFTNGVSVQTPF